MKLKHKGYYSSSLRGLQNHENKQAKKFNRRADKLFITKNNIVEIQNKHIKKLRNEL